MSNFKAAEPLIKLNTGTDLSTASSPEIHYQKPGGTTGEWSANISGNYVQYQTTDGDIDQAGKWKFQAVVNFGTATQKGDIVSAHFDNPIKET